MINNKSLVDFISPPRTKDVVHFSSSSPSLFISSLIYHSSHPSHIIISITRVTSPSQISYNIRINPLILQGIFCSFFLLLLPLLSSILFFPSFCLFFFILILFFFFDFFFIFVCSEGDLEFFRLSIYVYFSLPPSLINYYSWFQFSFFFPVILFPSFFLLLLLLLNLFHFLHLLLLLITTSVIMNQIIHGTKINLCKTFNTDNEIFIFQWVSIFQNCLFFFLQEKNVDVISFLCFLDGYTA